MLSVFSDDADLADVVARVKSNLKIATIPGAVDNNTMVVNEEPDMSKETELVFLGTGASLPSKYRNGTCRRLGPMLTLVVTSNYIHVPNYGNILLDCGEGSLGQLQRRYGESLDQEILDLKLVFISHIHADHHLGLIRVLIRRQQVLVALSDQY